MRLSSPVMCTLSSGATTIPCTRFVPLASRGNRRERELLWRHSRLIIGDEVFRIDSTRAEAGFNSMEIQIYRYISILLFTCHLPRCVWYCGSIMELRETHCSGYRPSRYTVSCSSASRPAVEMSMPFIPEWPQVQGAGFKWDVYSGLAGSNQARRMLFELPH